MLKKIYSLVSLGVSLSTFVAGYSAQAATKPAETTCYAFIDSNKISEKDPTKLLMWTEKIILSNPDGAATYFYQISVCSDEQLSTQRTKFGEIGLPNGKIIINNKQYCVYVRKSLKEIRRLNLLERSLVENLMKSSGKTGSLNETSDSLIHFFSVKNKNDDWTLDTGFIEPKKQSLVEDWGMPDMLSQHFWKMGPLDSAKIFGDPTIHILCNGLTKN